MCKFDVEYEAKACIEWIKNWFEKESGGAKGVVIGISGGKDSSVVAGLLCKAIGKDEVIGILMPNGEQKDIEDSKKICEFLKINYRVINIENVYNALINCIQSDNGNSFELSKHTKTNIAPRIRMTTLYTIGQELNFRVAGTGNASEKYVGYATKWGDTANDFNPIANFTTDEVVAIGKQLGLPIELMDKAPSDGLTGKTDEDNLGFSYATLNHYIKTGECEDEKIKAEIDKRHKYNNHKFTPIPVYNSNKNTQSIN